MIRVCSCKKAVLPDSSIFSLEESTTRLIALSAIPTDEKTESDIQSIVEYVKVKAPKMLDGLMKDNIRQVAATLIIKCFSLNEVVFFQGEEPDGYYTVIRGAVSVYARRSQISKHIVEEGHETRHEHGKFLTKLLPGSSFGELSFSLSSRHSLRNATIISDGHDGQSVVKDEYVATSRFAPPPKEKVEAEASNIAVLLIVPEHIYMSEMYHSNDTEHQINNKIDLLKESYLFKHWPMDAIVKLAYAMKKKYFEKGTVIAKDGSFVQGTWFIIRGKVLVSKEYDIPSDSKCEMQVVKSLRALMDSQKKGQVEIAYLRDKDMFGLIELSNKCRKLGRTYTSVEPTEVYVAENDTLLRLLKEQTKTKQLIALIAKSRSDWESQRVRCVSVYPSFNPALPAMWRDISNYVLRLESGMCQKELFERKLKSQKIFRHLREARELRRQPTGKQSPFKAHNPADRAKQADDRCVQALGLAVGMEDRQLESSVSTVRSLISDKRYGTARGRSILLENNVAQQSTTNTSSGRVVSLDDDNMGDEDFIQSHDVHRELVRKMGQKDPIKLMLNRANRKDTLNLLAEHAGISFDQFHPNGT